VSFYVQHHFSQDHRANLWPLPDGIDRMDVVLDGAAEIGFADIDGLYRYAEASPLLFGDVFHLFEHIVAYNLPRGSHTLVDREADCSATRRMAGQRHPDGRSLRAIRMVRLTRRDKRYLPQLDIRKVLRL
jgi:hypothetical protein